MTVPEDAPSIGEYRLIEKIGQGGMGIVYRAFQPRMNRVVALKVLPPYFASDRQLVERFKREAQTIAQLEHRNILPIFDFGESNGVTYLTMRYLDGGTLKDIMAHGQMTLPEAIDILIQICAALDYAHRQGVVHRDVKPANIMIDSEGAAYLTDFGLAKALAGASQLTETGAAVGTPAYMAPEQSLGNPVDGRADIYALGVILYELVVGRAPFQGETPMAVALQHVSTLPPLPRSIAQNVPEDIETIIMKAMSKDPLERFQTASDLASALRNALRMAENGAQPTLPVLVMEARNTRMQNTIPIEEAGMPFASPPPLQATEKEKPRNRWIPYVVGGVLFCMCACVALSILDGANNGRQQPAGAAHTPVRAGIAETAPADEAEAAEPLEEAADEPEVAAAAETDFQAIPLYDDFDDLAFEGRFDPARWRLDGNPELCAAYQEGGEMVVDNTGAELGSDCSLNINAPETVWGDVLDTLSARLLLGATDGNAGNVLAFTTFFDDGSFWTAQCGPNAGGSEAFAAFVVLDSSLGESFEESLLLGEYAPASFDAWAEYALTVDQETRTVTCLVDGSPIATYTVEDESAVEQPFFRSINNWRDPGVTATGFIDDVRLLE